MKAEQVLCDECGIAHDATLSLCPWCGAPAAADPEPPGALSPEAQPVEALAPQSTADERRRERRRRRLARWGVAVGLVVLGAILAEVLPVIPRSGAGVEPVANTLQTPATFVAPTTAPPTPIQPGDPLTAADVILTADGIGPLTFGTESDLVLGRLVATFGLPDEDTGAVVAPDGSSGLCPGTVVRTVRWGSLTTHHQIGSEGASFFASYRVTASEGTEDVAAGVATLSGLSLGDSVERLSSAYSGLEVVFTELGSEPGYEVFGDDGALVLWGALSSDDPAGQVLSINSPLRCTD